MIDYTRKRKNMGPDGAGFHPMKQMIQPRRNAMKEKTAKVFRSVVAVTMDNLGILIICAAAIAIIIRLACA